jgi:predicted transposase YbfD/YdcC
VLGQLRVADKSNEIPAVPELLALLALEGCIVTADALHCQDRTAAAVLECGGDYVLALKANRPALFGDVRLLLDDPEAPHEIATTTDGDHGRIETRRAAIAHDVAWLAESHGFSGLRAVGKVTASREQDGKTTTATRYYLLSRPLTAARLLEVVRAHWQIENRLHWVPRRGPRRGSGPGPQGRCPGKPRPAAALRPQRPARQSRSGLDPGQDQARRLG